MYWKPYRGGGWCVICEPPEYDGTNENILEFYQLRWDGFIDMIMREDQPPLLNIKKVKLALDDDDEQDENWEGDKA